MPKVHYGIEETVTYHRFSIIDSSYQIEITDVRVDTADSHKIIVKKEHLPKLIEILIKIRDKGINVDGKEKPIYSTMELEVNEAMPERFEGIGVVHLGEEE